MKDILEAVPIDKYFELFKPGEGAEGGFIRVSMNYLYPDQVRDAGALLRGPRRRGGLLPKLLLLGALAAGGALAAKAAKERQEDARKKAAPVKKGWGK